MEAFRAIGYTTISGAAVSRMNALRHYGLIERDERGYRITRLGHTALGAGTPTEVTRAQHEAAWRPQVLRRLRAEIASRRLGDVDVANILLSLDYSPKAAQRIGKVYRALVSDKALSAIDDNRVTDAARVSSDDDGEPYETLLQMREDGIRIFIDARRDKISQTMQIVGDWLARTKGC